MCRCTIPWWCMDDLRDVNDYDILYAGLGPWKRHLERVFFFVNNFACRKNLISSNQYTFYGSFLFWFLYARERKNQKISINRTILLAVQTLLSGIVEQFRMTPLLSSDWNLIKTIDEIFCAYAKNIL